MEKQERRLALVGLVIWVPQMGQFRGHTRGRAKMEG